MSAVEEVVQNINATVNEIVKKKASTEGMIFAYGSLVFMALVPIFYGSFLSVGFRKKQAVSKHQSTNRDNFSNLIFCSKNAGEKVEVISRKEAAMFPVYASCALFGLYIFFKVLQLYNFFPFL